MRKLVLLALVGLAAQLVDGSLGMGYGVTSATLLVAGGLGPAAASAAIHFAEIGTTLVSGASHHALGNVDWRTVGDPRRARLRRGVRGGDVPGQPRHRGVAGSVVAVILLVLGGYVTWRFLGPERLQFKGRPSARFLAPVGLVGGALDAVGGGGWGPVGTTSMLSSGRLEPRKVVGSVDTAEFVVTIGASLGFLTALGRQGIDWHIAAALLVGGVDRRPDRGGPGALPAGPDPRRHRRWPDRAHQPPDPRRWSSAYRTSPRGCSRRWCSRSGCSGSPGRQARPGRARGRDALRPGDVVAAKVE